MYESETDSIQYGSEWDQARCDRYAKSTMIPWEANSDMMIRQMPQKSDRDWE